MKENKIQPPIDKNGKEYWIPVMIKNRDVLLGFLDAFSQFSSFYEIPTASDVNVIISSDRYNDIMPDDIRVREVTKIVLKEKILEMIDIECGRAEHVENSIGVLDSNLLNLDCKSCNNFISFKEQKEIPEKSFNCPNCGRCLIHYTNIDSSDIKYDGNEKILDEVMIDINKDLGL